MTRADNNQIHPWAKYILWAIIFWALLSSMSCNPNRPPTTIDGFESIVILEGQHVSHPRFDRELDNVYRPTMWRFEDADYIHHPDRVPLFQGDQKDWNKLYGYSWKLYTNHVNSSMVGWRWNPDTELIELNSYNHVNEARYFSAKLVEVQLHQNFKTWITPIEDSVGGHPQIRLWIEAQSDPDRGHEYQFAEFIIEFQNQDLDRRYREIGSWFGGNLPVPEGDRILIYKKELFVWN